MLRDSIHLATPPPYPSEAPSTNLNPLATTPAPPTTGVKLSLATLSPQKVTPQLYKVNTFTGTRSDLATYSIKESERESRTSTDTGSDGVAPQSYPTPQGKAPAFGEDNSLLAPTGGKENLKRRKPKTSLVKSNSSYISRVIPHESMSKRVQDHDPEGLYVFANIDRAFQWLDLSSTTFSKVASLVICPV